jgi:hypothetical protein
MLSLESIILKLYLKWPQIERYISRQFLGFLLHLATKNNSLFSRNINIIFRVYCLASKRYCNLIHKLLRRKVLFQSLPVVSVLPLMNASICTKMDRMMTNTIPWQDALVNLSLKELLLLLLYDCLGLFHLHIIKYSI